jgi:fumarate reductase subunit D
MCRARTAVVLAMSLGVVAVAGAPVPAGAHTASQSAAPVAAPGSTAVVEIPRASTRDTAPAAAPAPVGASSVLIAAIALGAIGLGIEGMRRHPRRALVLVLGLLLAVFAFEDGLHSVHHGLDDKQYGKCAIAAASAHLSAVSVDGVLEMAAALVPSGPTAASDPASLPARLIEPHQGRAPPLATA